MSEIPGREFFWRRLFFLAIFEGDIQVLNRADHNASQHAEYGGSNDPIGYGHV
jgi:hypothetical protein